MTDNKKDDYCLKICDRLSFAPNQRMAGKKPARMHRKEKQTSEKSEITISIHDCMSMHTFQESKIFGEAQMFEGKSKFLLYLQSQLLVKCLEEGIFNLSPS